MLFGFPRDQPSVSLFARRPGARRKSHNAHCPTLAPLKIDTGDGECSGNRWSDLVPPQTALTFVAMYDPSEGLIGFSGSSLIPLDPSSGLPKIPSLPQDGQSEVFTVDHRGTITPALSTAALTSDTALRDMQAMLSAYFRGETFQASHDALLIENATPRVSSTLEGLRANRSEQSLSANVLLEMVDDALAEDTCERSTCSNGFVPCSARPCALGSPERGESGYSSAGEDTIDARTLRPRPTVDSFFMYDDCSIDELNERSAFSVTTTSTSSYIDVKTPSTATFRRSVTPDSDKWPPVDEKMEMEMESLNVLAYLQPRPKTPNPRLRKTSTQASSSSPSSPSSQRSKSLWKSISHAASSPPASPAAVLARETYNHHWDDDGKPPSPQRPRLRSALSKRLLRLKKNANEARWVLVEVEQRVTLHDLYDDEM